MSNADSRVRALILAYEDLDAEDRRKADEFLAENVEFRRQLTRLQQLEAWARDPVPFVEGRPPRDLALSAEDELQLARSLEALLARLGLPAAGSGGPPFEVPMGSSGASGPASTARLSRRGLRRAWIPFAAAATVLLLVWSPWSGRSPVQFHDAGVVALDTTTGSTRSAENALSWNSGDAFALSFRLEESARVIVYHVDPLGRISLVVPSSTTDPIPYFEAGTTHRIPSAMDGEQWVLGGETGRESFLLASLGDEPLDLALLDEELHARSSDIIDREQLLERVRVVLEQNADAVQLIEFDHLP